MSMYRIVAAPLYTCLALGLATACGDSDDITEPAPVPVVEIMSNFDDNTLQGWTLRGVGTGPTVHPTLFQSGAHSIWANGIDNWFRAPASYLGDKAAYFGAELSYWYLWSNPSPDPVARDAEPDIEITGVNGQTITLRHIDGPSPTVREWRFYSVRLQDGVGWLRANDGAPATRADIEGVLQNVGEFVLRASRRESSVDNNYIDEVRLGEPLI